MKSETKRKAAWSIVKSKLGCKKRENVNFTVLMIDEKPLKIPNGIIEFFNMKFIDTAIEIGV